MNEINEKRSFVCARGADFRFFFFNRPQARVLYILVLNMKFEWNYAVPFLNNIRFGVEMIWVFSTVFFRPNFSFIISIIIIILILPRLLAIMSCKNCKTNREFHGNVTSCCDFFFFFAENVIKVAHHNCKRDNLAMSSRDLTVRRILWVLAKMSNRNRYNNFAITNVKTILKYERMWTVNLKLLHISVLFVLRWSSSSFV